MKKIDAIPFIITGAIFLLAAYLYTILPLRIPSHWNAQGMVDAYSSKSIVFLFPSIILLINLFMHFLPQLEVFRKNVEEFKHFNGLKIALALFFSGFFLATVLPNFGFIFDMLRVIYLLLGLLFIYIGYIIKYIKRNFWIGIRTPWTLSDDFVWKKTHVLGSKLFIVIGAIFLVSTFLININIWFILIAIFLVMFYLAAYSFVLYRRRHK